MLRLSYSSIKDFEVTPIDIWKATWVDRTIRQPQKRVFTMGSLIDAVLFEPETIESRFLVLDCKQPTNLVCDIIAALYQNITSDNKCTPTDDITYYEQELIDVIKSLNYYGNRKMDTNLKNLYLDSSDYFKCMMRNRGKLLITKEDLLAAERLRDIAWGDDRIRNYLVPSEGVELKFQYTAIVPYRTELGKEPVIELKTILDILYIDHNTKTRRILDLKSTSNGFNFSTSVAKYGYGKQMSIYDFVIEETIDPAIKLYRKQPPLNIVLDKITEKVYVHQYRWGELDQERYGYSNNKGWAELVSNIAWHQENNVWTVSKDEFSIA